jgi:hypothetical protein
VPLRERSGLFERLLELSALVTRPPLGSPVAAAESAATG